MPRSSRTRRPGLHRGRTRVRRPPPPLRLRLRAPSRRRSRRRRPSHWRCRFAARRGASRLRWRRPCRLRRPCPPSWTTCSRRSAA